MSPIVVYAGCMLLCGPVTLVMPLLDSYPKVAAAAGAFGAFIAANYSLTSIILVEQITLEKFTNAYGLLLLIQGVANLVGPPLAGRYLTKMIFNKEFISDVNIFYSNNQSLVLSMSC